MTTSSHRFPVPIATGPMEGLLEIADLASVRYHGEEILRRVGVRVRTADWSTVPAKIETLEVEHGRRGTEIAIGVRHDAEHLAFAWEGKITLRERTLIYEMDGVAEMPFAYARIGIVLLHPPQLTAGRPYRASREDGPPSAGELPQLVGPQLIRDGVIHPLFPAFDRLEIDVAPGLRFRFWLEGDLFEMEDQRNWTDASFKTYSTPVGVPIPYHASPGARFRQRAELRIEDARPQVRRRLPTAPRVDVGDFGTAQRVPSLGTTVMRGHGTLDHALEILAELRPGHVRVELDGETSTIEQLAYASKLARGVGADIELEVAAPANERLAKQWLSELARNLSELELIPARIALARAGESVTTNETAHLARAQLPALTLLGGAPTNFAELNRDPPAAAAPLDGLYYAVNPQVHDSDDRSMMQSPSGLRDTLTTAAQLPGGRPVHVTPITLLPRRAEQADPRQHSLFAGAWLVASADAVLSSRAASASWFELSGPFGVSAHGDRFAAFHVLRELCSWRGLLMVGTRCSDENALATIGVRESARARLLVANRTSDEIEVALGGLADDATIQRLDVARGWIEGPDALARTVLAPYETLLVSAMLN